MRRRKTHSFIIQIGMMVFVQTVDADISGTVSNQAGDPINRAIVSLTRLCIHDTTGANGAYLLGTTVSAGISPIQPRTMAISQKKDWVKFNLTGPSPLKIELFDIRGALLKQVSLPDAQPGSYSFSLSEMIPATKLLFIRASIGRQTATFRCLPPHDGKAGLNNPGNTSAACMLSRLSVIDDTLKVSASGYRSRSIAVTSCDQVLNVSLDTADGQVTVLLDQPKQEMMGFGINNNWAPALSDNDADALFDSAKGIGLTILRIGMGPNGAHYNNSSPSDMAKAKARGCKYIIATVWTPPGSYKTSTSENNGGHVKPDYYQKWADTIAAFLAGVNNTSGATIYAMSIQTEPDYQMNDYPTTLFTADELVAFLKVAGPKIHTLDPPVKVIAPEPSQWTRLWTNNSADGSTNPLPGQYDYGHALYKDAPAWAEVDILGAHQYYTQAAEPWPADVPRTKPVWMTEMSGIRFWPEGGPSRDIGNGVAVAGWIHDAIVNGFASAWCWWWYNGGSDTNEGLLLNGQDTKRHYTLGNFSKFIRPGYARVGITGTVPDKVLLSAYKGPDNTLVIVAINKGDSSVDLPISITGGTGPASLTPWVTSVNDNLAPKTPVTLNNSSFSAALPEKTVTTFVGR